MKYSGADWVALKGKEMSEFGRLIADILGQAYQGIYHIDREALRADWSQPSYITINLTSGQLATYDLDHLTTLVVLCHDHAVRMEIQSSSPHRVKVGFSKRQREGQIYYRHPTIEDAVANVRAKYSLPEEQSNGAE